ncbi:hypothetical protein B0H13DRAFT_1896579 [Mycena leptocephala]|nr:hypothetical protein B0H13DRAFT_1896579 [Mycena leptocephala]
MPSQSTEPAPSANGFESDLGCVPPPHNHLHHFSFRYTRKSPQILRGPGTACTIQRSAAFGELDAQEGQDRRAGEALAGVGYCVASEARYEVRGVKIKKREGNGKEPDIGEERCKNEKRNGVKDDDIRIRINDKHPTYWTQRSAASRYNRPARLFDRGKNAACRCCVRYRTPRSHPPASVRPARPPTDDAPLMLGRQTRHTHTSLASAHEPLLLVRQPPAPNQQTAPTPIPRIPIPSRQPPSDFSFSFPTPRPASSAPHRKSP